MCYGFGNGLKFQRYLLSIKNMNDLGLNILPGFNLTGVRACCFVVSWLHLCLNWNGATLFAAKQTAVAVTI